MDIAAARLLLEQAIAPKGFNKIQRFVLEQSLADLSYRAMAEQSNYDEGYLKDIGSELWQWLSKVTGQKVSKQNLRGLVHYLQSLQAEPVTVNQRVDWGEAIEVSHFYGRVAEQSSLTQWLLNPQTNLVGIFAMGGMGKTALAVKVTQAVMTEFERIVWWSLRDSPPLTTLLPTLLTEISQDPALPIPEYFSDQIACLLSLLQQRRSLLIWDNFDALFTTATAAAQFREGYENYGELLTQIGQIQHQSCLLITSREMPLEMSHLEDRHYPAHHLLLKGLDAIAAQHLLTSKGLNLGPDPSQHLIETYQGNPLALHIAATALQTLFPGELDPLLTEETLLFTGIHQLLASQLERLNSLEQSLLYWLAIHREPVTLGELKQDFFPAVTFPQLLQTVESLQRRSLLESTSSGFTQQPVIMEYITEQFINHISQEIITQNLQLFRRHALLQATSKDYIRESQNRLIVTPILHQLSRHFPSPIALENALKQLISLLRKQYAKESNYGGGNILNLLRVLKTDLSHQDFSLLTLRQAYLQDINLHQVNFSQVELLDCVLAETFGGVTCVTFSPDGQTLATSDTNGELQRWDSRQFQQLVRFQGHVHWAWSVAFNADASLLVSGGQDQTVRIWDSHTGKCLQVLTGHQGIVTQVVFSPDAPYLASSSQDRTVKIWHWLTGQCEQTLTGHGGCVWSVQFTADGQHLVTGSEDGTIKIWERQTGRCQQTIAAHDAWIWSVALSPDGQTLASSSFDRTIKLWDWATGDCLQILRGHSQPVTAIAFSPNGQILASGSYDQTVRLWQIQTGECRQVLAKHSSRVWSVAFAPDGQRLVSGGDDHATCIWQLPKGNCTKTIKGHSNCVYSLALSPDRQTLASTHESQVIHLWDLQDPSYPLQRTLRGHQNRIFAVVFTPDGQHLISASGDRTLKIWQTATGQCLHTLAGHHSWVWSVAMNPDGQTLASGSYDHTIKLWNLQGDCLATLTGHPSSILTVQFSPDGRWLASGGYDQVIKLWDWSARTCVQTLTAHGNRVWCLAFSADGQEIITGGDDQTLQRWHWPSGTPLQTLTGHQSQVLSLLWQDQQVFSSSGDRTLKIWDLATGTCQQTLNGHQDWIWSMQLDTVQKRLFSGSNDETIKIWDYGQSICQETLRVMRPYEGLSIDQIRGITEAQRATLLALGARE